ncbi:phytanoyl-CoA dioxygenase [Burkholderia lata]|uniref:Phytanoyl-CoA dioxygenase n=1 Tax=Burkholderia lata (strain ATCC 17760 / DSM 23089 / LMG 22485 / NCIMB 9086 / R18194 / 383) TaxID=482957 RepID=A0A6P2V680_BURL3|nr:glycosyltransferase family A protein [Burkholderia lata]VWC85731.1 phytanoyl-CoA dioxygenase [Burkholderia lata]
MNSLPPDFSAEAYLLLHPDVRAAGVDPAQHYLEHGRREGRRYLPAAFTHRETLPGEPGFQPLPLIVISYNRGAMLRRVIASYRRQSAPVEIIVHDNGSSDPDTLRVLDELTREGIRVFRRAPISDASELNLVDETVSAVFSSREPGPYIVTDCDIDLAESSPDAIAAYLELLNAFSDIECVGPMLRIDDIRKSYPLFGRVMNRHISQFWHQRPEIGTIRGREIATLRAPIDTTFAVHRTAQPFRRLKSGMRVYTPFDGRHLDWYPHEQQRDGQPVSDVYQRASSPEISHWDNQAYLSAYSSETPEYDHYVVVRQHASGALEIDTQRVADNPD